MKQFRFRFYLSFLFLLLTIAVHAQLFVNDAGEREKHFVYEVKQIDEFFERFNNDDNSFLRGVYKTYHVNYDIKRETLIKSLFDYQSKSFTRKTVDSFANAALKVKMPSKDNFYGDDWYAEANCIFQYNATEIVIPVILRIFTDKQKQSKWLIVGTKAQPLESEPATILPNRRTDNNLSFLNPASHCNNFIELHNAFGEKENLTDYFSPSFFKQKKSVEFYNAILTDHLKFLYVKDIKYHFLQVSGWIFDVEYFRRDDLNSGWLIDNIKKSTTKEKEDFKKTLLGA